jgi:hypothetical protein
MLDIKRTGLKKLSEAVESLDYLVIVFSDTHGKSFLHTSEATEVTLRLIMRLFSCTPKDKTLFLQNARFYGIPNPAMIPPLGLQV